MDNKSQKIVHTVNIYARERIEVLGATEVISSTEKEVIAKLSDTYMSIFGANLTIVKLVPEDEILIVSGNITGIKYENKLNKKSFFGKMFKWQALEILTLICF